MEDVHKEILNLNIKKSSTGGSFPNSKQEFLNSPLIDIFGI